MNAPSLAADGATSLQRVLFHFDGQLGAARRLRKPRALLYATSLAALLLFVWAGSARVDRVVRVQGRVIPSGKPQLVQHLEGGIVSQVFVKEGDVVSKGQNLLAVSDLMANASRGEKNARLRGLQTRAARLQAEADGAERFSVPAGLEANAPEVRNEGASFQARRARLHQTTRVLEEQISQKRQESAEQEARRRGLAGEREVAQQQLALITGLLAKNAGSQLELLEARARVERLATQIRECETAMPRLASAALELQARLAEAVAQFRSESRATLADTQIEIQRLRQDLHAEDDRVKRTMVVAPAAGSVNKLLFNTVGGVVKPGDTLLELTPDDEAVVIETRALPAERGALQLGQKAVVRVAAFDYTVYGTLAGRVNEISADSLIDEHGERYFRVGVTVDPQSRREFGQVLSPGMTVSADAVTGNRTILQYLLSPIRGIGATAFRDHK
ncbi:MAG: HlyD family type I secretion periplasmic adaptor subunit [Burkholderiales bacterium]|jgi:adhesin transport system membrane fusion protein|nr:HlyD family type I secretion periplasmic adaptor subunit [Burkholderiales bacterium]